MTYDECVEVFVGHRTRTENNKKRALDTQTLNTIEYL
jgi:hypothetical protein